MAMVLQQPGPAPKLEALARRYKRPPRPLFFPAEEQMPETGIHLELRTALYEILKLEFAGRATIGSDQFVYWDPTNPRRCLAPDAMMRLGGPDEPVRNWKVWERGAPHVAVEVISDFGDRDRDWDKKQEGYRQCGILEVVRFDPDDQRQPLRIFDHIDGDLVERELEVGAQPSCLGLHWVVIEHPAYVRMLRLSRDAAGKELLPTPRESAAELKAAERRIAELEALLRAQR
jgi:Uma2 family endonuclease